MIFNTFGDTMSPLSRKHIICASEIAFPSNFYIITMELFHPSSNFWCYLWLRFCHAELCIMMIFSFPCNSQRRLATHWIVWWGRFYIRSSPRVYHSTTRPLFSKNCQLFSTVMQRYAMFFKYSKLSQKVFLFCDLGEIRTRTDPSVQGILPTTLALTRANLNF